jgi:hypothetical protein
MPIAESQLETWAKQGPTSQFTATYDTLKGVLNHSSAPYYSKNYSIFLQGSYKNDTNVYGDSDVDVVIRLDDVYYTDLDQLSEEDKALYNVAKSGVAYDLPDFKADVLSWLKSNYGNDVQPGSKAIFVKGNGSRRNADVLVCAELRRYHRFKSWSDQSYIEGVCFFTSDGTRINNFPRQHSDNCTEKHKATENWFKPTVRIYKNLRNTLIEKKLIEDGLAPSHFLEGLLYNVPVASFGGSEQQNFVDTLNWLNAADRSKFLCANQCYYLFHPSSRVTWRAENCTSFINAVVNYWNKA